MLRVSLMQAKPGMVLATPVMHPDRPGTLLLRAGFTMDDATIERLKHMRVPEAWIEYPDLSFVEQYVSPSIMQARGEVAKVVSSIVDKLRTRGGAQLPYDTYREAIRELVRRLGDHPSAALYIQAMSEGPHPMMRHAADVCYLSLLMGLKLDAYLIAQRKRLSAHRAKDVVSLGLAGILHDVGMLQLEPETLGRWNRRLDERDRGWREHVKLGFEKVRDGLDAPAASAILNHHQHYDGSGFPLRRDGLGRTRGLAGDEIHIFARVLTAADLFDRGRHPPGTSETRPAVLALSAMRDGPYAGWVDPIVFNALLSVVPPYAPGSVVTLSNGTRCAVGKVNPEEPCRPQVVPLPEGPTGKPGSPIVLSERSDLVIAEADGVDVTKANFFARYPGEFRIVPPEERQAAAAA